MSGLALNVCVGICQSLVVWDGEKLVCVQKGEKENRGWKQWIEGDLLHLVRKSVTHFKLMEIYFFSFIINSINIKNQLNLLEHIIASH